jgi:hypothetical protein
VSEPEEELEIQALQRELDDAFATTRPRPALEDELWLRIQSSRPAPSRLRDAIAGFFQGIRAVPAVPAAAVAALLVIVIGVGIVALSGVRFGPGGASTASQYNGSESDQLALGTFGRLPTPVFNATSKTTAPNATGAGQADLAAPAQLTWTGKLDLKITSAPVFRYREPTTNEADQFASALGAVLRERPPGFLGMYSATDYTLKVRGTVQLPPSSPAYFIFASATMPPVEAAGASPQDLADIFLAQHSLSPQWRYTVSVDGTGDPVRVRYERQFDAPGYGAANLVDINGNRYGLEVDLSANRPVVASGVLPATLDQAGYKIVTADEAIRSALASGGTAPAASGAAIKLNQAELVYVLVPAGDHSFYEPAFLFSGQYQLNGQTLTKRVLVPAVDPSQRTP